MGLNCGFYFHSSSFTIEFSLNRDILAVPIDAYVIITINDGPILFPRKEVALLGIANCERGWY